MKPIEPIDMIKWMIKWIWSLPYTLAVKYHTPMSIRILILFINAPLFIVMMVVTIPAWIVLLVMQMIYEC